MKLSPSMTLTDIAMPHSVSPEANSPPNTTGITDNAMVDSTVPEDVTQVTDGDVAMEEAEAPAPAAEEKSEVKLDDLFADADSDDEFPSSRLQDAPSSSPDGVLTPPSATWVAQDVMEGQLLIPGAEMSQTSRLQIPR